MGRVKTKCRLANETLRQKAACGLNKLVNLDKSAQASDECAPGSLSAPFKESKGNEAAPIRLFGKCAETSEPDALNLTA